MRAENSELDLSERFRFETTEDGSPTVRIASPEGGTSEAMHSLRGAFSETVYIYGSALETMLAKGFTPSVLSMGLGLGYVELLATALFIKAGVLDSARGESFEIVPELREWFRGWLFGEGSTPAAFAATYREILHRVALHTDVADHEIHAGAARLVKDGRWLLSGALTAETRFSTRFGCICFDAFSSKTTPDVWGEEFLTKFLADSAAPQCVLSTYACTGALKRALKTSRFELDIRLGFSSKRDSTFAVRAAKR